MFLRINDTLLALESIRSVYLDREPAVLTTTDNRTHFFEGETADALRFFFETAEKLKPPVVINLDKLFKQSQVIAERDRVDQAYRHPELKYPCPLAELHATMPSQCPSCGHTKPASESLPTNLISDTPKPVLAPLVPLKP